MLSIRFFCFLVAICCTRLLHDQAPADYTPNHETIFLIEQWIADSEFDQAIVGYESLIADYGRLLARDAFNACQLAALRNHPKTDSFYYYCALAGVPEPLLKQNLNTSKVRMRNSAHYDALYKMGNQLYTARIDTALRKEFISRFNQEQQSKGKPEYKDIVTRNFNRIRDLAMQGKFPGEQTIGVDNNLEIGYVTATLLHYPNSYKLLYKEIASAIRRGEVQPLGAIYVYGFNQTRTSVLYDTSVPADPEFFKACFNLPFGKFDHDTAAVDANRKAKYISSLKVHNDIERVMRQYHIDYKLGF